MFNATSSCGFVENGWENAMQGIDEALARDPNFGREWRADLDASPEQEPPRGWWGKLRAWLTFRRIRHDTYDIQEIHDRLAPRDALY